MNNSILIHQPKFNNYLILIFSLLPISIISGNFIMEINVFLIIISFLYFSILNKEFLNEITNNNFFYLILILWVYLIINSFLGVDFSNSIRRNLLFFKFLLLILAFKYLLLNFEILKKILSFWTIIILIVCFDVYFEFLFGFNILGFVSPMKSERIVSFFKDELIVGNFLYAFLFIIVGSLIAEKKFKLAISIGIIISLCIFLSGERSIMVKFIFSFFLIVFFLLNSLKIKFFSIIFFLIITSSLLNIDFIKNRYLETTKKELQLNNEDFSKNILDIKYLNQSVFSFEILKNYIYFGVGNKNYFKECRNLKINSSNTLVQSKSVKCYTHPHQTYYEFIAEHGIVGTSIIILIFYKLLFQKYKNIYSDHVRKSLFIFKIYCIAAFLPIVPTGSFFSSFQLLLFFLNYSFFQIYLNKKYTS